MELLYSSYMCWLICKNEYMCVNIYIYWVTNDMYIQMWKLMCLKFEGQSLSFQKRVSHIYT